MILIWHFFVVSDITEIDPEDILSTSKKMEVVEARVLLYRAMVDWGYHPAQIAMKVRKEKKRYCSTFGDLSRKGKG